MILNFPYDANTIDRFDTVFADRPGWVHRGDCLNIVSIWEYTPSYGDSATLGPQAPRFVPLTAELDSARPDLITIDYPRVGDDLGPECPIHGDTPRFDIEITSADLTTWLERAEQQSRDVLVRDVVQCWIFGSCSGSEWAVPGTD